MCVCVCVCVCVCYLFLYEGNKKKNGGQVAVASIQVIDSSSFSIQDNKSIPNVTLGSRIGHELG